jgi:acetyltransferase-like isoleucine patch superfamily enzyme
MRSRLARFRGYIYTLQCGLFRQNIKIGKGLKIYKRLSIKGEGQTYLGENCTIGGTKGDSSQYVTIDTHSRDAVIRIGDNTSLYAATISAKYEIVVGNDVLIEQTGVQDTDFHSIDKSRKTSTGETKERCRIVIGDRVCIGTRCFIMKGVKIGNDVIIVPGSVVNTSVKPGSVICGNPAKAMVSEAQP